MSAFQIVLLCVWAVFIAVNLTMTIITRRINRQTYRLWVRCGVIDGGIARRLGGPVPLDWFNKPYRKWTPYQKGFLHGHISTGKRLMREGTNW